jgi:hypothetical protein
MTPTLITTRSILELFDDPDGLRGRPEAVYFRHPMQSGIWAFITDRLYRPIPAHVRAKLRDDFEKFQLPLTKAFHDKGGKLMTGTDSLLPGLVHGFALHRELRELVGVGLTPFEALQTRGCHGGVEDLRCARPREVDRPESDRREDGEAGRGAVVAGGPGPSAACGECYEESARTFAYIHVCIYSFGVV